jgi:hypothetical protein
MDQDQSQKIKHLVSLFEMRDRLYQESTEKIFEAIGPTALEALVSLFNVSYENVSWLEVQLIDNIMLIVASITYNDGQTVPAIIQTLSPIPESGQATVRLFRVGLPLELLFQPKQQIVDYLTKTAEKTIDRSKVRAQQLQIQHRHMTDTNVPISGPQPEFDTSKLTHEQRQQLMILGAEIKGIKH